MRAGDRWAEVRQDEHGREVRMAERRAAIRTDETGTHLRVVDRWSTVREDHRQDEPSDTFENTGETRAQRRAREAAEHDDWDRPSNGRPSRVAAAPNLGVTDRAESRSSRHVDDDAPSHSRRGRATDGYQSFTPRPLESSRPADERSGRDSWDEHRATVSRSRVVGEPARTVRATSRSVASAARPTLETTRPDRMVGSGARAEPAWAPRASHQTEGQPGVRVVRDVATTRTTVIPASAAPSGSSGWTGRHRRPATRGRPGRRCVAIATSGHRGTARSWESVHDRETQRGRDIGGTSVRDAVTAKPARPAARGRTAAISAATVRTAATRR